MMRSKLFWSVAVATMMATAMSAQAAEDYKITRCPPDLPYCIQEVKPAYTKQEIERRNEVRIDPAEEARKIRARSDAGYRDPNARALACGAGYRMTERDGCQPAQR